MKNNTVIWQSWPNCQNDRVSMQCNGTTTTSNHKRRSFLGQTDKCI